MIVTAWKETSKVSFGRGADHHVEEKDDKCQTVLKYLILILHC